MGPSTGPWTGPLMSPLMGPLAEPSTQTLTKPSTGQVYFQLPFRARAVSTVPVSIGAPLSWLGISAKLPVPAAGVLGLPLYMSVPQLSLRIFLKLSAFLPMTILEQ